MNPARIRGLADRIEFENRFHYPSFFAELDGDGNPAELYDVTVLVDRAKALAHRCGTVGCVAGWAVADAWLNGENLSDDTDEVAVMARWLEIPLEMADHIAYGGLFAIDEFGAGICAMDAATAVDVAKALREMADGDRVIEAPVLTTEPCSCPDCSAW